MSLFFDKFERRVTITGKLRCLTALRIGAGKDMDPLISRLPVLRDSLNRPLLPGASIKGVVRSQVESLLRADPQFNVCDPLGEEACLRKNKPKDKPLERKPAAEQAENLIKVVEREICDACRIFGGPNLASHVVFADALPLGDVQVERRDGVAIDRDSGRAFDKRKYDYEVVPAGTLYDLRLALHNLERAQEGIVVQGLELLGMGFARLGGFKSRGLGEVALEDVQVKELVLKDKKLATSILSWNEYKEQLEVSRA